MSKDKYPICIVEWEDCESVDSWTCKKKVLEEAGDSERMMVSVGYLVCENDHRIVLVHSIDDKEGNFAGIWYIPQSQVKSMVEVVFDG